MGKKIDLTGQVFGKLTVLKEGERKNGKLYWTCQCECGNIKDIYGYSLRKGDTISCGQCKKEKPLNPEDNLVGKIFNYLTVIKYEGSKPDGQGKFRRYWTCQCECGNTISVSTTDLKDGHIKSCGCKTHEIQQKNKMKDIQNQRFGKLIALEPDFEKSKNSHGIVWLCKCDCGNNAYVKATQLLQGKTKSCGCLLKEVLTKRNIENREVQIGKQYGYLLVTGDGGYTQKGNNNRHISLCKCLKCGRENIPIIDNYLQTGRIKSCGCLNSSIGEVFIQFLLEENNISFIKEYTPININYKYRYDFAIFENDILSYLIEFDGIQHFQVNGGWNTVKNFNKTQEHDKIKNQWCKDNNIPLIRIPYTHLNDLCLEDLLLETSSFIV